MQLTAAAPVEARRDAVRSRAMERARHAVAILGSIATILAGLAAIFPDTFAIRGTPPPLSSALRAILGLALPLAVGCAFVYLLILDRRLRRLLHDHRALADQY